MDGGQAHTDQIRRIRAEREARWRRAETPICEQPRWRRYVASPVLLPHQLTLGRARVVCLPTGVETGQGEVLPLFTIARFSALGSVGSEGLPVSGSVTPVEGPIGPRRVSCAWTCSAAPVDSPTALSMPV